ncbi:MAG: phosphatase PAP2 family protein [Nitrospirota bacterium]
MNLQTIEEQFLLLINNGMTNTVFDIIMPFLTRYGYLLVIPFLVSMILLAFRTKKPHGKNYAVAALGAILISVCAFFVAEWIEDMIKIAVARPRPCRTIEGIRLILPCPKSFSLPSGHAITSFACALPLFFLTRRYLSFTWRLYPLLLAAVISFSRLYLGLHYPTDVLAGAFLGAGIGLGLSIPYDIFLSRKKRKRYHG